MADYFSSIPVLGHGIAVAHYAFGDEEAGNDALYKSTRTTMVIGGGIAGGLVAGPAGAAAGGMSGGALTDSAASLAMGKPKGYVDGVNDIVRDLDKGRVPFKGMVKTSGYATSDALAGRGASKGYQAHGGGRSAAVRVAGLRRLR